MEVASKRYRKSLVKFTGTFVNKGIFHYEFISEGKTLNKWMYNDLLRCLRDAIRIKRSEKWRTNNLFLPHNNAPAHRSVFVKDFFKKNNVTILENLSDLAAATFTILSTEISNEGMAFF